MRTLLFLALLTALMAMPSAPLRAEEPQGAAAAITSIRAVGDELVVTVGVPAGKRRVTIESRPRLMHGAWIPREVRWSDTNGPSELTFTLPLTSGTEMLRVRDESEGEVGLPPAFFAGTKEFAPTKQPEGAIAPGALSPGGVVAFDTAGTMAGIAPDGGAAQVRAVVESDIWKLDGRTLYFFNQQRGLQVIDLTDADHPVLTGTLPLAVWGEQMYRLPAAATDGSVWLALLAQQGCGGNGSEVLLVNVKQGRPMLAGRLPVRGQIKETRLVGDALYLATYDWSQPPPRPISDDKGTVTGYEYQPWESHTVISAFDLADPARPFAQPVVELPVSPDAIAATDRFLFVATTGTVTPKDNERVAAWAVAGNHAVLLFDLTDPHGALSQSGFLLTAGRVADKFKLGQLGTTGSELAVVSQVDGIGRSVAHTNKVDGSTWTSWEWLPPQAVLETFSLADPTAPTALGHLTLVTNESLFATRFAVDRAYVVTFRQTDPLWIVDLSDAAQPTVKGHLQIPGYSTYLQPLADNSRLLALGVDGGRTTVQLFDVADAAKPSLLSKVFLGEGWSWSEGNSDEKAFQVFSEVGLALVPWQGQRTTDRPGQWFQGVQLIDLDLGSGTLKTRGVIDHALQARRATLLGDRVVSLSAQELLTVDATDRDKPSVVADLPLSTQVDRVFVSGGQLVELRNAGTLAAQISLATPAAPETPIASLPLDTLPIIGSDLHQGRLFVVQFRADEWRNESTSVTNPVVKQVPQPPLKEWRTNFVVTEVPAPLVQISVTNILIREQVELATWSTNIFVQVKEIPLPIATNHVSTTKTNIFPPSPGEPGPRTEVLTWIRPGFTSPSPALVTNAIVKTLDVPQPPLLATNWVLETTWQTVRVPGESRFSVIGIGDGTLQLMSQLKFSNPEDYYGAPLTALWASEDNIVWTERAYQNGWGNPWFGFNPVALNLNAPGAAAGAGTITIGSTFLPGLWWGPWWGNETRNFLAFDVADPAAPKFASRTRLGETNGWNGFSETFAADGKLFVSHRVSTYVPAPEATTLVTNLDGIVFQQPVWQPGTWEHRHSLDVLDFTDLADPVVRAPADLPGPLSGISHDGLLVYAKGADIPSPSLHALAYDGLQASLVASLPLPTTSPQPLLVRADGKILLGRITATADEVPALETWALSTAGQFERYASLPLPAAVEELHAFGDLLVATSGDRFRFFGAADATALIPLGDGDRPCALGLDWTGADASPTTGLWLARGPQGIWQVPLKP